MANITPKGNGTYLIRISCGSDASGKPITKSKIFKPSKPKLSYQKLNKEIEAFIKAFEEEIETYGIQERPEKIRFAEFCEKYLDIKKSSLSPITYAFYEKIIREELIPIQCYSIKQVVPLNILEGLLNTVKMLLMKIFIKLDKTYGSLDELDVDTDSISPEEIANTNTIINEYIFVDNSIKIGDKNQFKDSKFN